MEKEIFLTEDLFRAIRLERKAERSRESIHRLLTDLSGDTRLGIKLGRNIRLLSKKYSFLKEDLIYSKEGYRLAEYQTQLRSASAKLGYLRRKTRLARVQESVITPLNHLPQPVKLQAIESDISALEEITAEVTQPVLVKASLTETAFKTVKYFSSFAFDYIRHTPGYRLPTAVAGSGILALGTFSVAAAYGSINHPENPAPTPTKTIQTQPGLTPTSTLENSTLTLKAVLTPTSDATPVSKTATLTETPTKTPTSTDTPKPADTATPNKKPTFQPTAVSTATQASAQPHEVVWSVIHPKPSPEQVQGVIDIINEVWGNDAPVGKAIASCESGYDPLAYQIAGNRDSVPDFGVFQLHGVPLADPRENIVYAFLKKFKPSGTQPWVSSMKCWYPKLHSR